jgi:hypothetical protein
MALEEEQFFFCPYCSSELSIMIEAGSGRRQTFTIDCETCCRPILIRISAGPDGMIFEAEQE